MNILELLNIKPSVHTKNKPKIKRKYESFIYKEFMIL
jgi:hypothetical protein